MRSTTHGASHGRHCFVAMPTGADPEERRWFKGWYEVVIRDAVIDAGFEPILAAHEEQPGAINDEIRSHLAFDPIVIVDIGGSDPGDEPNPNVMYELGIRHALGLPLVLMAFKGQQLPFDVSNQRAILEDRDYIDIAINKSKLKSFMEAALAGKFYRPMEAVGRIATIQAVAASLGEDSLLGALAQEVKELRRVVESVADATQESPEARRVPVKALMRGLRSTLYTFYTTSGGSQKRWAKVLRTVVERAEADEMRSWDLESWKRYISERIVTLPDENSTTVTIKNAVDEDVILAVRNALPEAPFNPETFDAIAEKLHIRTSLVRKAIRALISRGDLQKPVLQIGASGEKRTDAKFGAVPKRKET